MRSLRTVSGLNVRARLNSFRCALAIVCLAWWGEPQPAWASPATAITLFRRFTAGDEGVGHWRELIHNNLALHAFMA
jgi:hypothetical protein